ncbi:MAG: hypothetical protein GY938_13355, partial [Ketobacter sp.]|nr:hypothetical protein [Ketobacter sp.]
MEQDNLFAVDDADPFVAALDRYGTWPVTVWDCDFSDPTVKQMKAIIGDDADSKGGNSVRENLNSAQATGANSVYGKKGTTVHISV